MTISYYDKHYNKYQEVRNHLRSQGFKCLKEIRGVKKVSEMWGRIYLIVVQTQLLKSLILKQMMSLM